MNIYLVMLLSVHHQEALNYDLFLSQPPNRVNIDFVKAVNFIIEKVFLKRYSTVNIISAVENPYDPYFLDFKTALFHENKGFCIYRLDNHNDILTISQRLKIYNVFLMSSYTPFEVLFKNIVPEKFDYRGRYLFVLINGLEGNLNIFFPAMWKKGIIHVNTLYERRNNKNETDIQLETFMPFQRNSCGNTDPVVIDTLENGQFTIDDEDIFPDKVQNLFGCEVRMVTFDRCPGSCVIENKSGVTVYGFDIAIIDLIAERLNFKLNKTILLGPEQWGNVLPNGSTTPKGNAIERLLLNQSDIAIGNSFLRPNRVTLMDHSTVYYSFPVMFAIPRGERLTAFEKLLRPFEDVVWILLLIIISIGLLVILMLNLKWKKLRSFVYGTGIRTPVINM